MSGPPLRRPEPAAVCAVLVTYHPDAGLAERLARIRPQVGALVVVDNHSDPAELERVRTGCAALGAELIANPENGGVGAALNTGVEWARAYGFAWVLTLDQDTVAGEELVAGLLRAYDGLEAPETVAVIAANYRHSEFGTFGYSPLPGERSGESWFETGAAITSGSLVSIQALDAIGPFCAELFIDHVDTEHCFRARRNGYRIVATREPLMEHAIGQNMARRVFGRTVWNQEYSPARWYYQARNTAYLVRAYGKAERAWARVIVRALVKAAVKTWLFGPHRIAKTRSMCAGALHGLAGRLPELMGGQRRPPQECGQLGPKDPCQGGANEELSSTKGTRGTETA